MRKFVQEQTQQRLKKLGEELRGVRKTPHDEDGLHDLRVASRRFVQCLRTFKKAFDRDEAKKLRRRLKGLMQRSGEVRDHDVAIRLLAGAGVRDATLVVKLAMERAALQKKLAAELERWRGKRALSHWRKRLKAGRMAGSAEAFGEAELPRLTREWFEAGDKAATSESYAMVHRFRILSKQYRYTLEMFRGTEKRVEQVRQLQDYLGAMNDCVATKRLVRGHEKARQAIDELLKVREREFHAFWKKAEEQGEMELYILRHGEAEPRESGVEDGGRALVKKGKIEIRAVMKAARRAKIDPQLILTSPLRRARETAEIAVKVFKDCPLKETDALLPDASPEATWKAACANTKVSRVVLVGHEPHLSHVVAFLLGSEVPVDLKKGALVRIDTPKRGGSPHGSLKWMITPRLARAM